MTNDIFPTGAEWCIMVQREVRKMARMLKFAAVIVLCAVLAWGAWVAVMLAACDEVLVFGFRGLENLFRPAESCYAVLGNVRTKVPAFAVKLAYPPEEHSGYSKYGEGAPTRYFVKLVYNDTDPRGNVLEHGGDPGYTIEYKKQAAKEHELDPADNALRAAMLDITGQLYDLGHVYDPASDKWTSRSGGDRNITVTWFEVYCCDGCYIADVDGRAVYSYNDGALTKLMDVPENGGLDYCIIR